MDLPRSLRLRDGRYFARLSIDGRDMERALDAISLREARKALKPTLAQMRAEARATPAVVAKTFGDLIQRYRQSHVDRLRPRSQERFEFALAALKRTFPLATELTAITREKLLEHQDMRLAEVEPSTLRLELLQLSGMLSLAADLGWVASNPVPGHIKHRMRQLKPPQQRTRYLSKDEELAALAVLNRDEADLVAFAIDSGLRRSEQFNARWRDIDWSRREIIVPRERAKNGKERRVPLLDRAYDILIQRKARAEAGDYWGLDRGIFGVNGGTLPPHKAALVTAKIERTGIRDLTWHDLRRTCGCRLLQDYRMELIHVSQWLGHQGLAVTQRAYAFLHQDALHDALKRSMSTQS